MEWFDRMTGEHPRCDEYLGLTVAEVRQSVDSQHLRIMDTNEAEAAAEAGRRLAFMSDLHPNRVNVLVQDGLVIAAARFDLTKTRVGSVFPTVGSTEHFDLGERGHQLSVANMRAQTLSTGFTAVDRPREHLKVCR